MSWIGNIALGQTIDFKFTTRAFASGAPTTLAGSPAVAAYVDNGTTEITAGITLSVDFDSRTGLNNVRVVATGGNGYAAGTNVEIVITAGTVGGTSVVGEVVGSFSIENRSISNTATQTLGALTISGVFTVTGATVHTGNVSMAAGLTVTQSTANTAGITVTGNGTGAGILSTSGSGATGNGITAASAATNGNGVSTTGAGTGDGLLSTGGAGAGGDGISAVAGGGTDLRAPAITGTLSTVTTATTATNLTNAPTAGDLTATMKASVTTAATAATPTAAAVTGAVGSVGVGGIAANTFAAGAIDAAAIAANAIGTSEFAVALQQAIADVIAARALAAESYAADGAVPTFSQALYMLIACLTQFAITGTTISVKKLNGTDEAMTYTLDSAVTPTSRDRTT